MEVETSRKEKLNGVVEEESSEEESDSEEETETLPIQKSGSGFLPSDPIGGVRKAVSNFGKEMADRSHEMTETLKPFLGKVFHAVGNSGAMYRYRVGFDGRLTLERRLKGSFISVEKFNETKVRILEAGKSVPLKARRKWRAAVTGDPEKRIRDHMKETPQVKMMDKVSFTLGVVVICFSEWLLLRQPNLFPIFYYCLMPILFIFRYFEYAAIKSELYMLDFCYFVNLSVALQTAFYPNHLAWFQANYVLSMGPICFAIVVWRNSLVFHSLDKITSFFLHSFPPMICHIYRWKILPNEMVFEDGYMGLNSHFLLPLGIYMIWQIGYLFITEVILSERLTADPEIVTSLRYLSRDEKNSMNQLVTIVCRKFGFLKRGEPFDPETKFAKTVFVLAQLMYTLATLAHTPILFTSYMASCLYIVFIFVQGVWNGASYYIEVFSKRYNLKFEEKKPEKVSDQDKTTSGSTATASTSPNTAANSIDGEGNSDEYSSTNEDDQEIAFEIDDAGFLVEDEGLVDAINSGTDLNQLEDAYEPQNKGERTRSKQNGKDN